MKLAKQILQLTSIAFIAVGLSFVLISSIAIGSQTSLGNEFKALDIVYKAAEKDVKGEYDLKLKEHNDKVAAYTSATFEDPKPEGKVDGWNWFASEGAKTTAVDTATKARNEFLNGDKTLVPTYIKITVNSNTFVPTVDAGEGNAYWSKAEIRDAKLKAMEEELKIQKVNLNINQKDRLSSAMTAENINTGALSSSKTTTLSPMGAVLVSGLALTLAGAAMVVAIMIMNKMSRNEPKAPAKKSAAA